MSGNRVGHYELIDKLGQGGMGVVYRARDTRLGRAVALKFLPAVGAGQHQRDRFLREAVAASSLDHPNICTIFEVGEAEDGRPFIAMALYEGQTFRELIGAGPLSVDRTLDIATQAAEGLAAAHAKQIVHRDIKPANLMLTTSGLVKVLDFGLARAVTDAELTAPGNVLGTMAYMSPEQFRAEPLDSRTDVWSLGVVVYELLTGRRPIESSPAALAADIQAHDAQSVRRLRADVPSGLADILGRALARDLVRRYARVENMIADLRRCAGKEATGAAGMVSGEDATATVTRSVLPRNSDPSFGPFRGSDPAHTPRPSIAVLPFKNLSSDEDNAYFSDGLTDELIHALAGNKELRVISRTSVFELQGKGLSLSRIGEMLGVDSILEGSVRKAGSRVRILARLVQAADDEQMWSERFDRELEDVFAVQDEIAHKIAERLEVDRESHGGSRGSATRVARGHDREVLELHMRGRHHWNRRVLDKSLACYQEALERDPQFALAHIGVANYHAALGLYAGVDPKQVWPQVRASVLRGLELDRDLPEAHIALGYVRTFEDWDWSAASRQFRIALELAPGLVDPHVAYSMHMMQTRQFDAVREHLAVARRLDPLSALVRSFDVSSKIYEGDFEQAAREGAAGLEIWPDAFDVRLFHAIALQYLGRCDEALEHLRQVHAAAGEGPVTGGFLGACLADAGREDEALELLARLQPVDGGPYLPPTARAFVLTALGRTDEAFAALEDAAEQRDSMICYSAVMPGFGRLRGDSRFEGLLGRIGLPDAG